MNLNLSVIARNSELLGGLKIDEIRLQFNSRSLLIKNEDTYKFFCRR